MRFLPLNLTSFLVELNDLDETLALLAALQANPLPGIREMVPAARTLMIGFAAETTSAEALAASLSQLDLVAPVRQDDRIVEVPVDYQGEDLAEVAELTGLSVEDVIRRHAAGEYKVAFCGFAPGFGYLVGGDPALHVPRRKSPRLRIPAGTVALAGHFTGVYPQASPGGWQLIGTTPVKMWDIARNPPAYFQPGYRVRFIDLATVKTQISVSAPTASTDAPPATAAGDDEVQFSVTAAPLPALFQDLGRFGQTGQGVSASGALDRGAFKAANRMAGNDESEPCLELMGGGFSFRSSGRAVIGVAGAPCGITIRTAQGKIFTAQTGTPLALEAGDEVSFAAPASGVRSYLAVRGGFKVAKILGSAATDTLAMVGPAPVQAGSALTVNDAKTVSASVALEEIPAFAFPKAGEIVTLDLILGPRPDWFTAQAVETLTGTDWVVTPQSNRVGIRLDGDGVLERSRSDELPSEGTVTGAVEVPPNGKPLLFLADHPLTGGYPVIGAVAEYHLDLAGQIPVGAKIRFRSVAPFAEIRPSKGRATFCEQKVAKKLC
ncbi:MAG TPA: urea amidolyase family protein [Acidocella sp.]|jgi:KipI family sensor histidine kinase inhibitor|uniref:5-oxoprolinase subunit B/C family protein n=1 Tax=Acidocella sp. TaxID=50710 RepID=UPI002BC0E58D|nr:urea amidolyase family protein [Acidocella sp.]HVE20979.1 urea amidolyase family protein [Acidocella sp.]